MPKLIPIPGKKMIKLLKHRNFEVIRVRGSHHFLKNKEDGLVTTILIHNNEELGISIIKNILSDVNMDKDEYEKLRRKI